MMEGSLEVAMQLLVLLKVWIDLCEVLMKLVLKISMITFERMLVLEGDRCSEVT